MALQVSHWPFDKDSSFQVTCLMRTQRNTCAKRWKCDTLHPQQRWLTGDTWLRARTQTIEQNIECQFTVVTLEFSSISGTIKLHSYVVFLRLKVVKPHRIKSYVIRFLKSDQSLVSVIKKAEMQLVIWGCYTSRCM